MADRDDAQSVLQPRGLPALCWHRPCDGEEYSSAIWAAQRIPDDSYAAVTNAFIIRDIDRDSDPDTGDFLFSESVFTTARRHRWWSEESGEPLDFAATFSDGEYANKCGPTASTFCHEERL